LAADGRVGESVAAEFECFGDGQREAGTDEGAADHIGQPVGGQIGSAQCHGSGDDRSLMRQG
jgi:hypothetical protein